MVITNDKYETADLRRLGAGVGKRFLYNAILNGAFNYSTYHTSLICKILIAIRNTPKVRKLFVYL